MDRRKFCKTLAGMAVVSMGLPLRPVMASEKQLGNGLKVTSFSDGEMRLPISMLFDGVPQDELDAILAASNIDGAELGRPLNVILLETDSRKILFDAGSGTNFLSGLGELPEALESAGIDFDDITDVVFTHAHPDHIWGIMDDFDDLLMPDAAYHISQAEWDFWDSDDALAAMPQGRENFAVGAKSRFDLIRDQVNLFNFGDEILPGIEAVDSRGHTPGHAAFIMHQGTTPFMILGDALTHPVISFSHHDWVNQSDMDPMAAIQTRQVLLDRLTADKMMMSGYHLPAPGFGRVEADGARWRYLVETTTS